MTRKVPAGQGEMFPVDTPAVTPPPPEPEPVPRAVRWAAFTGRRQPCDHCMKVLLAAQGHGPLARAATVRRIGVDGSDLLLCAGHGEAVRTLDHLHSGATRAT